MLLIKNEITKTINFEIVLLGRGPHKQFSNWATHFLFLFVFLSIYFLIVYFCFVFYGPIEI